MYSGRPSCARSPGFRCRWPIPRRRPPRPRARRPRLPLPLPLSGGLGRSFGFWAQRPRFPARARLQFGGRVGGSMRPPGLFRLGGFSRFPAGAVRLSRNLDWAAGRFVCFSSASARSRRVRRLARPPRHAASSAFGLSPVSPTLSSSFRDRPPAPAGFGASAVALAASALAAAFFCARSWARASASASAARGGSAATFIRRCTASDGRAPCAIQNLIRSSSSLTVTGSVSGL